MNNFLQDIIQIKTIQKGNIGLMGGSFNPPHFGHLYISNFAIKKLNLSILLWLITPLNPFKQSNNLLPLEKRYTLCNNLTKNNYKIKISVMESDIKSSYTFNTINKISKTLSSNIKLFWIMGEDLLYNFDKFYRWYDLTKLVNIVIISRGSNFSSLSLNQKFPQIMKNYYISNKNCNNILKESIPTWSFFLIPRNNISSTLIRTRQLTQND